MNRGAQDSQANLFLLKAQAALEREEWHMAEVNFAQVLHLDPGHALAMASLHYAELKRRPTLSDHSKLDEALRLAPRDPSVLVMAARIYVLTDRSGQAVTMLERAKTLAPTDAQIWAELASMYLGLRNREASEAALSHALSLDAGNELALKTRAAFAKVYFNAPVPKGVGEVETRPTVVTLGAQIADAKATAVGGDAAQAYWLLREAVRQNPSSREAKAALAAMLRQRFPLYSTLEALSKRAIQYRVITSFLLVFCVAKLLALLLAADRGHHAWTFPVAYLGIIGAAAVAALILLPMATFNFCLRYHAISKRSLTKSDRFDNRLVIGTLVTLLATVGFLAVVSGVISEFAVLNLLPVLGAVAVCSLGRSPILRTVLRVVVTVAWIGLTALTILVAMYSMFARM